MDYNKINELGILLLLFIMCLMCTIFTTAILIATLCDPNRTVEFITVFAPIVAYIATFINGRALTKSLMEV